MEKQAGGQHRHDKETLSKFKTISQYTVFDPLRKTSEIEKNI